MARAPPLPAAPAGFPAVGTRRTTGSPRLAMTTSSPACADLMSCDSRFLASRMLTCIIPPSHKSHRYSYSGQVAKSGHATFPDIAAAEALGPVDQVDRAVGA